MSHWDISVTSEGDNILLIPVNPDAHMRSSIIDTLLAFATKYRLEYVSSDISDVTYATTKILTGGASDA